MKDLDLIYCTVRELPAEERSAYMTKACEGDGDLRMRVEQMLTVADEAEAFIADLPDDESEDREPSCETDKGLKPGTTDIPDEVIGQRIGRYKILERLGEGGCGVVYVAEQTEPVRRRVALKVIKLGMDTKQVVARFEAERQALAMMDHPNIAKVLDAGTTGDSEGSAGFQPAVSQRFQPAKRGMQSTHSNSPPPADWKSAIQQTGSLRYDSRVAAGRPFFVMELVRGIKITDYCDEANLTTKERLDLFIRVCQAIQHAHQKGIIHRDIKPTNILVTLHDGVPVPKVIDFGIAKATEGRLTDATVYTQLHQFIGTPAYMSPEQAEMSGLDIDTRSDIYSLGVLLYELLAGATPFDAKELMASGIDAMRKTIREKNPMRPSTRLATLGADQLTTTAKRRSVDTSRLLHQLKGDLDWIVMKCLEKDRARRYDTANGLVMDIRRHLSCEPVLACPPSKLYEFQKTVRRHKFGFGAATALFIVLTAGVLTSAWQAVEATKARKAEVSQRIAAQGAQAQATAQQKKAEAEWLRAEEQLTRAEWLLYASKLMLAQTDFEAGNGGLALHYLGECQENLRGWEYRYLWTRINAKQTLVGHVREVSSVAFSEDGKRIVTGSEDQTAKVWDAATGRQRLTLKGHTHLVSSVAFSADGKRIITGAGRWTLPDTMPGEAKVWDAATGQELLNLKHTNVVWSVAFSTDGRRIITGSEDRTARVWDAVTGQELLALKGHALAVSSVAFSPDGKRIVTGSMDKTAQVWDAATGREVHTLKGHTRAVNSVAISADGHRIVTGAGDLGTGPGEAKVWDAVTGREILALKGHVAAVLCVMFSPDDMHIVTGSQDKTAKVWDAATGQEVFTIKGHEAYVRGVAFSPDGKNILTGSNDQTAKVWDAATGQEVPTLKGHTDFVSSIAFSPGSNRIVTGSGDGTAKVWDAATGQEILTLKGSTSRSWSEVGVWSVAFSPDGKSIVTGSQDKTAQVWDAATGQELLVLKHANVVSSVAFSPDGKCIVTGSGEWGWPAESPGETKVWDAETGQELLALKHTNGVWGVAFSPDGKHIVTGSKGGTAKVWDATTGQELLALKHANAVWGVAFSPDGTRIVTGSWDNTAKVWDAGNGQELLILKGHTGYVRSVAFSPDSTRIVTGSDDRTAKLWDAKTGYEVFALKGHTEMVWSVAFSPDGERIVTGIAGANATANVWYAPTTLQKAD